MTSVVHDDPAVVAAGEAGDVDDVVDVMILGGGVAGLTLALQLVGRRPELRVAIVERQQHPVPEAAYKVGESTVEIAGHYLREVLGLGEHLGSAQLSKFGLRVFFTDGGNGDISQRVELGHSVWPPGGVGTYQLDRGRLENALAEIVAERSVRFWSGSKAETADLRPDTDRHVVGVRDSAGQLTRVGARWVIDATGRTSFLKRQLHLAKDVSHKANAAWMRIDHPIDVDEWCSDPVWQDRIVDGRRMLSTNHLMGPGYWVWLIPLASGSTSVGIVADAATHQFDQFNRFERALEWLDEHEPQCAAVVAEHRDKVQDFRVMRDYAYSAQQLFSADRWCLSGEAGVFLDPLYSPGLDLIAIGNGLITDLIEHELDGEDVEERAAIHNQMFLLITENWLRIYADQYPLMGNARIMLAKVIWDTAVYWAVPGLLYFRDAIRKLVDLPDAVQALADLSTTSEHLQRFFREWGALAGASPVERKFVQFYDFDFMRQLHIGMTAGLSDDGLEEQLVRNVRLVRQLSGQLVDAVISEFRADVDNAAKQQQAAIWENNDILMAAVDVYRLDNADRPVSDEWFTLRPSDAVVSERS